MIEGTSSIVVVSYLKDIPSIPVYLSFFMLKNNSDTQQVRLIQLFVLSVDFWNSELLLTQKKASVTL